MDLSGIGHSRSNQRGLIFNIQPFSIHDGPGIRTTLFTKGCPLRCQWCSNPDGWNAFAEIMTRDSKCVRCGRCAKACPVKAITVDEDWRKIDWARCSLCLECARVCPNGAIIISGKSMSVDEVVQELARDRLFYENSGGGVTISGGEPLMQAEFVAQAFEACKEKGIHTALDTTGLAPWETMESVLEHVDLVLYDLKHMDPEIHKRRTGVSNELILSNLQKTAHKIRTWVRIPVIPGFNDSDLDIQQIVDFSATLPVEKVSLLPYHGWAHAKYEALGIEYPMKGSQPPSDERINEICEMVTCARLKCTIQY